MNLNIRKFKNEDVDAFLEAVTESVEHLSPWLEWCTPEYGIDAAREYVSTAEPEWQEGNDYRMLIEDTNSGALLGCVAVNQVNHIHKIGNLGYWVRKSAINRNVCARAARELVKLAFTEFGLSRVEVTIHPDNHASNAVAVKLGATYEGTFRNKIRLHGESTSARCYSIVPSDYGL